MQNAKSKGQRKIIQKARSKRKELIMVAMVSVLSIGLFSASSMGINQLTFAAATNRAEPLPPVAASDYTTLNMPSEAESLPPATSNATTLNPQLGQPRAELESEIFQPPTLSLEILETPYAVPESAMTAEEAAQIGARYIGDVFGASIDNTHVSMTFSAPLGMLSTWWMGHVFAYEYEYAFVIDSITGERVDISRKSSQYLENEHLRSAIHQNAEDSFYALAATGWWDMDIDEQIEYVGVSSEVLEFGEIALELAKQHFNNSVVMDIRLGYLQVDSLMPLNEKGVANIEMFTFIVTDDNGREAIIHLSIAGAPNPCLVNIITQHNDFVPSIDSQPVLQVFDSPYSIPAAAMSPEDAAQIGAHYIWDVFGTNIDGILVQMSFNDPSEMLNSWWEGYVLADEHNYSFTIDSITGERIDLIRFQVHDIEDSTARWELRQAAEEDNFNALAAIGWWDMDIDEQIAFAGVFSEVIEHGQTALTLAMRHFNNSVVRNIRLESLHVDSLMPLSATGVTNIDSFQFVVTDSNGREAYIHLYTSGTPYSCFVNIITQHNNLVYSTDQNIIAPARINAELMKVLDVQRMTNTR